MDIGFTAEVPGGARPEIEAVLAGIKWPTSDPPERLTVRKQLAGGRSGARVLQVDVVRSRGRIDRRVIKIDRASAIAREWSAYVNYLADLRQAPFTPMDAASAFIQKGDLGPEANRMAAVVYLEVAEYSAVDVPATTLEEVAREAVRTGDARKAAGLTSLLMRQVASLHRPVMAEDLPRTLRSMNAKLGVDLTLEVDRPWPAGGLSYGDPLTLQLGARRRYPADVLAASTSPHYARRHDTAPIEPGDVIVLEDVVPREMRGEELVAEYLGSGVTIGIRPAAEGAMPGIITDAMLGRSMTVVGRVAERRVDVGGRLIQQLLPDCRLDEATATIDGLVMRHPFARLHGLLTEDIPGRVNASLSHGDLNPRNVLAVAGQIFLIDFARTGRGGSPSWDAAWLETCLMRDVIAPALTGADLIWLQRLLGAATRVASCAGDAGDREMAALLPENSPARAAFDVLWTIRDGARRERPAFGRPRQDNDLPWWRDYLAQLTLAACTTLKWPIEQQNTDKVRSAVVLASVAAEWLGARPYRFWRRGDLRSLAPRLASVLGTSDPQDSAAILAALVGALREIPADDAEPAATRRSAVLAWQEFERARTRLVAEVFREQALEIVDDLRDEHDVFVAIEAFIQLNAITEDWRLDLPSAYLRRSPPDYRTIFDDRLADPLDYPTPSTSAPLDPFDVPENTIGIQPIAHVQFTPSEQPEWSVPAPESPDTDPGSALPYGYGIAAATNDDTTTGNVMTLIAGRYEVVVVGGAGSGKSTVARELQYQLAHATAGGSQQGGSRPQRLPSLMPILVRGRDVDRILDREQETEPERPLPPGQVLRAVTSVPGVSDAMLGIGAVHLTIDAFNELTDEAKHRVANWVGRLRRSFPFIPVMFCYRRFDFERNPLPYVRVFLQDVTDDQARNYMYEVLKLRELPDARDRAAALASMLLDNPENGQVRDLAQKPLFLWMIVERYADGHVLPDSLGALMADFSKWFVEERHRRDRPGESVPDYVFSYADKFRVLEAFGVHLVEHGHGETDLSDADAGRLLDDLTLAGLSDSRGVLQEIVSSELLYRTETGLRFYHQSFQEYFAARVFERESEDPAKLRERTLSFDGRESMRMMLGFSGGRPELARQVIRVALQANSLDAAELLRACETPPAEAIAAFLQTLASELADPRAGAATWKSAAEALSRYQAPGALAVLDAVAKAPGTAVDARLAALKVLLTVADEQVLTPTVAELLTPDTPLDIREAAVRGVGARRLPLLIQVAGLIADGTPWPLIRAAHDVLERSGERLTLALRKVYEQACQTRLTALEDGLRQDIPNDDWDNLQDERLDLLEVLSDAGQTDLVLARRFAYRLADEFRWDDWLAPESLPAAPPIPPPAVQALSGDLDADDLVELFAANKDPLVTCAAGHALLEGQPDPGLCARVVRSVTADSTATQMLVAAAIADNLDEDPDGHIEALIRSLIDRLGVADTEPLAALLAGYPGSALRHDVLVYKAEFTAVERRLESRLRRPLTYEWHRSRASAYEQLNELLCGTDEEVGTAVGRLYSDHSDFGMAKFPVSDEARQRFLNYAFTDDRTIRERYFICGAAADMDAYEVIDLVISVLDDEWITQPETLVTARYGPIHGGSRLMYMFRYLGELGRAAHAAGQHALAAAALERLTTYSVKDGHEADELGRRAGLAYLGRWKPLLTGLPEKGRVWHDCALYCIKDGWIPGPYTPQGEGEKVYIARWIARELTRPGAGYSPTVRSTLTEIKTGLETDLRRYIVTDDNAS